MHKKSLAFLAFVALSFAAFAAQAKTVEIEGTDSMKFSVEEITVQPGEEVTIKLVNNSDMPPTAMSHNLVVLKQDVDASEFDKAAQSAADNDYIPEDRQDDIIAHTELVGGGESDTITFTAPEETGDYDYICTFPGHFAAGMKGVLKVVEEEG